jgi:hypothetical protein
MDESTINRDSFDRQLGAIEDLPDVLSTKATTIVDTTPIIGLAQTFIIQSYRQRDVGDRVFLQFVDAQGTKRIVIPPKVAQAIARQRSALTKKSRSKGAREAQNGRRPGFLNMSTEARAEARTKAAATRAKKAAKRKSRRANAQATA